MNDYAVAGVGLVCFCSGLGLLVFLFWRLSRSVSRTKVSEQASYTWRKAEINMHYRSCRFCGKDVGRPGEVVWLRDTKGLSEMAHEDCLPSSAGAKDRS